MPDAVSWQWRIAPQRRAGVPVHINPGRPDARAVCRYCGVRAWSAGPYLAWCSSPRPEGRATGRRPAGAPGHLPALCVLSSQSSTLILVVRCFLRSHAPFPDPAVGEFVTELNSHASAFLFGRRTFDIFRGYWPDQTDPANPIATAINSLPKYVVSNSFSQADATWRGEHPDTARLVTGDVAAAVQALKDEPGDELQIWGSSKLLQTLLQHELVDRYRLMTFPLVLGSGRRLFNDGILPAAMRPAGLTVTDLGIVIGTYEPAGPVRHGQM